MRRPSIPRDKPGTGLSHAQSSSKNRDGPGAAVRRFFLLPHRDEEHRHHQKREDGRHVPAALTAVMETYLPIACVINLLRGAGGAQRERLIQRIAAALRSED